MIPMYSIQVHTWIVWECELEDLIQASLPMPVFVRSEATSSLPSLTKILGHEDVHPGQDETFPCSSEFVCDLQDFNVTQFL